MCCAFTADRQVSSGGTVFIIRRRTADCPAWAARWPVQPLFCPVRANEAVAGQ
jgi:hypothetical protein